MDLEHQVWQEGDAFPGDLNVDQQNIVNFSGQSYFHFLHAFGRDSYDGARTRDASQSTTTPASTVPNANWNGATTNYCTGVTADDVVAHEWGARVHGIHPRVDLPVAVRRPERVVLGHLGRRRRPDQRRRNGHARWRPDGRPLLDVREQLPDRRGERARSRQPARPRRRSSGRPSNTTGVTGDVVLSNDGKGSPTDGCTSPNNAQAIAGNIALVDRGLCAFTVKVANMQKVGATGVMIANNVFGGPTIMPGVDPSIQIPSVMITLGQGAAFKNDLAAGTVNVTMRARTGSQGSYRWLMGEDATAFGGAIRDMWDPTCLGDPGKVTDQEYFCASSDNGGVHANSGIPNHGFASPIPATVCPLYVPPLTSSANPWFGIPELACTPPLSLDAQKYSWSVTLPGSPRQVGSHMSRIAPPKAVASSPISQRYEPWLPVRARIVTFTVPAARSFLNAAPWPSVIITDGIWIEGSTPGMIVGPPNTLLAIITPVAPTFSMLATFTVKAHRPRSTSAMLPATVPAFVNAVHPVLGRRIARPGAVGTSTTLPVSPDVGNSGPNSAPAVGQSPAIAGGLLIVSSGFPPVKLEHRPSDRTGAGESVPAPLIWSTSSPQMSEYDSFSAPGCHW